MPRPETLSNRVFRIVTGAETRQILPLRHILPTPLGGTDNAVFILASLFDWKIYFRFCAPRSGMLGEDWPEHYRKPCRNF
jgi:hypothetical protein